MEKFYPFLDNFRLLKAAPELRFDAGLSRLYHRGVFFFFFVFTGIPILTIVPECTAVPLEKSNFYAGAVRRIYFTRVRKNLMPARQIRESENERPPSQAVPLNRELLIPTSSRAENKGERQRQSRRPCRCFACENEKSVGADRKRGNRLGV